MFHKDLSGLNSSSEEKNTAEKEDNNNLYSPIETISSTQHSPYMKQFSREEAMKPIDPSKSNKDLYSKLVQKKISQKPEQMYTKNEEENSLPHSSKNMRKTLVSKNQSVKQKHIKEKEAPPCDFPIGAPISIDQILDSQQDYVTCPYAIPPLYGLTSTTHLLKLLLDIRNIGSDTLIRQFNVTPDDNLKNMKDPSHILYYLLQNHYRLNFQHSLSKAKKDYHVTFPNIPLDDRDLYDIRDRIPQLPGINMQKPVYIRQIFDGSLPGDLRHYVDQRYPLAWEINDYFTEYDYYPKASNIIFSLDLLKESTDHLKIQTKHHRMEKTIDINFEVEQLLDMLSKVPKNTVAVMGIHYGTLMSATTPEFEKRLREAIKLQVKRRTKNKTDKKEVEQVFQNGFDSIMSWEYLKHKDNVQPPQWVILKHVDNRKKTISFADLVTGTTMIVPLHTFIKANHALENSSFNWNMFVHEIAMNKIKYAEELKSTCPKENSTKMDIYKSKLNGSENKDECMQLYYGERKNGEYENYERILYNRRMISQYSVTYGHLKENSSCKLKPPSFIDLKDYFVANNSKDIKARNKKIKEPCGGAREVLLLTIDNK